MLAQPRRKQVLVGSKKPKSKYDWFKESSSVACSLLSKMGYSPGDGLGTNGQGISDPIRLEKNKDKRGVGYGNCASASDDKLAMHMDNFNSILSGLAPKSADKKPEKPSKSEFHDVSQVRRHKLCTRRLQNKNLSNKNSRDVEIVLGSYGNPDDRPKMNQRAANAKELMRCMTKSTSVASDSESRSDEEGNSSAKADKNVESETKVNQRTDASQNEQSELGISVPLQTSKLSMDEYFKQKMEQKNMTMMPRKFVVSQKGLNSSETNNSSKAPSGFCRIPQSESEDEHETRCEISGSQNFVTDPNCEAQTPPQKEESLWSQVSNVSKVSYAEYFRQKMQEKRTKKCEEKTETSQFSSNSIEENVDIKKNKGKKCLMGPTSVKSEVEESLEEPPKKKKKGNNSRMEVLEDIRTLVNSDDQIDDDTSGVSRGTLEKKLKLAEELTQKVFNLGKTKPKKNKKKKKVPQF